MKIMKKHLPAMFVALMAVALSGCERQTAATSETPVTEMTQSAAPAAPDPLALALALHEGDSKVDQEIRRFQEQVRSGNNRAAAVERLGWAFVAKAHGSFDPGYYKLAEAFSQLYDRLANVLFSVAVQILNDAHAAEDAVQEVFVQIWAKAGTYDPRLGKPMTWAVTLLRNKAIDRLRAAQRGHRLVEAATAEQLADEKFHEAANDSLLGKETARAVRGAVARLAPEQKQAIELAFFSGLTQTEIAATLQAPLGTVKARIRRGMLELREVLEAHTAQNN